MNCVFFAAVSPSIGNCSATTVNDAVAALLDALCVTHQPVIGWNRLSATGCADGLPDTS
jgi:hypothetical protein